MSQLNVNSAPTPSLDKFNETILVVKRTALFPDNKGWFGLKQVDFDAYLSIITEKKEFIPRGLAENDSSYKQIIPYLVFEHGGKYFLMQRQATASESRLASKYSLGIGGHLREEDIKGKSLFEWAQREFHEEIDYTGNLSIEPLGILNDDTNEVGKVHIGFVFLLRGDSSEISIRSELASGKLLTMDECKAHYIGMETWSQLVFNFLQCSLNRSCC